MNNLATQVEPQTGNITILGAAVKLLAIHAGLDKLQKMPVTHSHPQYMTSQQR